MNLLGKSVRFRPGHWKEPQRGAVTGTVVWVHPQGRFALVERPLPPKLWGGASVLRECVMLRRV